MWWKLILLNSVINAQELVPEEVIIVSGVCHTTEFHQEILLKEKSLLISNVKQTQGNWLIRGIVSQGNKKQEVLCKLPLAQKLNIHLDYEYTVSPQEGEDLDRPASFK